MISMGSMKVLVACEESQEVCKAFRKLGHEAFSCDILPCSGGHPEWHIQGDVLDQLDKGWDLMIAHPPCTYLSHAGCRWLYPKGNMNIERFNKGLEAREFFMKLLSADIPKVVVENPFPSPVYKMPDSSQTIQPFQFGHGLSKKTLLWIKGLPELKPTKIVECEYYFDRNGIRHSKLNGWSAKRKSKTFRGIAKAMAEQWGGFA